MCGIRHNGESVVITAFFMYARVNELDDVLVIQPPQNAYLISKSRNAILAFLTA
jgi:hypothetical protein